MWTLSFGKFSFHFLEEKRDVSVLVMAGWGFLLLLVLYFLIDHRKLWDGAPFYFVGMNSILVYEGLKNTMLTHFVFSPAFSTALTFFAILHAYFSARN